MKKIVLLSIVLMSAIVSFAAPSPLGDTNPFLERIMNAQMQLNRLRDLELVYKDGFYYGIPTANEYTNYVLCCDNDAMGRTVVRYKSDATDRIKSALNDYRKVLNEHTEGISRELIGMMENCRINLKEYDEYEKNAKNTKIVGKIKNSPTNELDSTEVILEKMDKELKSIVSRIDAIDSVIEKAKSKFLSELENVEWEECKLGDYFKLGQPNRMRVRNSRELTIQQRLEDEKRQLEDLKNALKDTGVSK